MINGMFRLGWFTHAIVLLGGTGCSPTQQGSSVIRPAKSLPATSPWDLVALSEAPTHEWADQDSPVWSLYYRGDSYQGKPTRVFAYYASPATIKAEDTEDTYPAVVLVHGGGGRAFKEWAQLLGRCASSHFIFC